MHTTWSKDENGQTTMDANQATGQRMPLGTACGSQDLPLLDKYRWLDDESDAGFGRWARRRKLIPIGWDQPASAPIQLIEINQRHQMSSR